MPRTKRTEGNAEFIKLREELERTQKEHAAALDQVAVLQQLRGHAVPVMRDARDALAYCSKLEDFAEGGKHRGGFVATVGPVLQRLEAWLNPSREQPAAVPAQQEAPKQADGEGHAGEQPTG